MMPFILLPPFSPTEDIPSDSASIRRRPIGECLKPSSPGHREVEPAQPMLATFFRDADGKIQRSMDDIRGYLTTELNMSRLNAIHEYLWLAGRPTASRPLHRQAMLGRTIVVTEQTDLHLCSSRSMMFLKPIPTFLLNYNFWKEYLCHEQELHENACGLLLSYVWLVQHESDFKIAKDLETIPKWVKWSQWAALVNDILQNIDANTLQQVNKRYQYGELRLDRLDMIYRLAPKFRFQHLVRGYLTRYTNYTDFFNNNFKGLLVVFVYVSIVLTAMQVGLTTEQLQKDTRFQATSYGFAVFAIIVPVIVTGVVFSLLAVLVVFNLVITLKFGRKQERDRKIWIEENNSRHSP